MPARTPRRVSDPWLLVARRPRVYYLGLMASNDGTGKPYRLYRAEEDASAAGGEPVGAGELVGGGDPAGGGLPPRGPRSSRTRRRRRRRSRRLLFALTLLLIVVAALVGVAAATGWGPFGGGEDAVAEDPSTTAIASAAGSPSASPSFSPSRSASEPATVTVTAGGDVIGGFGVSDVVGSIGSALFKSIAPTFEKSDFGFVNLESPLTTGGEAQSWKDVVIKGNPDLAPAMAKSGIDVVTMANNHAGDMGDSGLLDSFEYCEKSDIAVVGAGKNIRKAMAGVVLTSDDGARVAFLGFTDVLPAGYPATSSSPGTAPGRADLGAVKAAIRAARKKADYVVVGWHWNYEYKRAPSWLETKEGKAAIDAGADVVFAHHPHLLDGVEAYHGGLIVYSLGNLVFSGFSGETAETMLVRAKLSPEGVDAQLVPVVLSSSGVPTVAKDSRGESILNRVKSFSAALDTKVKISRGLGYVHVKTKTDEI